MAFPQNLKIWVNSREYSRISQTATYPPFRRVHMVFENAQAVAVES